MYHFSAGFEGRALRSTGAVRARMVGDMVWRNNFFCFDRGDELSTMKRCWRGEIQRMFALVKSLV